MEKIKLTEHFTLEEMARSQTAQKMGLLNAPKPEHIACLKVLCQQVLEPLRLAVGKPVIINSGYRCWQLNRRLGGARNSQHLLGQAADIRVTSVAEGREWFAWIMDHTTFDQLIWEHRKSSYWIHVSCRPDVKQNRHQVLYR